MEEETPKPGGLDLCLLHTITTMTPHPHSLWFPIAINSSCLCGAENVSFSSSRFFGSLIIKLTEDRLTREKTNNNLLYTKQLSEMAKALNMSSAKVKRSWR